MKTVELTCRNCGSLLEVEGKIAVCPSCGTRSFLDDENRTTTHNVVHIQRDEASLREIDRQEKIRIMELEYKERKEKRDKKIGLLCGVGIPVTLLVVILLAFGLNKWISESQGKISAGNYKDYVGKNYQAVVQQFEEMGFTNVVTIDLDDAGWDFWNDEEVESVTIAGDRRFESTNYFYPDAKVIIRYY